ARSAPGTKMAVQHAKPAVVNVWGADVEASAGYYRGDCNAARQNVLKTSANVIVLGYARDFHFATVADRRPIVRSASRDRLHAAEAHGRAGSYSTSVDILSAPVQHGADGGAAGVHLLATAPVDRRAARAPPDGALPGIIDVLHAIVVDCGAHGHAVRADVLGAPVDSRATRDAARQKQLLTTAINSRRQRQRLSNGRNDTTLNNL